MAKIWMLLMVLVCSAAFVVAQNQDMKSGSQKTETSGGQTSVEGCLQGSNGNFTLTDSSGNTYQLQGDASKLADHVGHEVKITGTISAGAGNSSPSSASGESTGSAKAGQGSMLMVEKVQHVSKTCKSAGR